MTTLSDLTLKQLTAIFSVVSGKTVGMKFFNGRSKALSRLETLLAEKNLTIAEAMRAAGIETDEEPATAPTVADEPAGTNDAPLTPEANDTAPIAPPDAAAILTSSLVINDTRDLLVRYLV